MADLLRVPWKFLAALQTPFNSSITIATFGELAGDWNMSVPRVSYLVAIRVVPNAIGAINGFGTGIAVSVGAATITDIFFQHERGSAIGVWTLLTNTGSFWGILIGCFVMADAFKTAVILNAITLVVMIFCMPETLYPRIHKLKEPRAKLDWIDLFFRVRRRRQERLRLKSMLRPIQMALYPSVFLPSLLTGLCNTLVGVGIALIDPSFFADVYGFGLKASGLTNIGFIIGALLGELFAGRWPDSSSSVSRHIGLDLLSGEPLRFAVFGYKILVIITTAYSIDCYKPQAGYVGAWFNCIRQSLSIAIPFFDFCICCKGRLRLGIWGLCNSRCDILHTSSWPDGVREEGQTHSGQPEFDADL
ncbi:hypothetical protein B7463_g10829, partial [Scytalidium lignicola]